MTFGDRRPLCVAIALAAAAAVAHAPSLCRHREALLLVLRAQGTVEAISSASCHPGSRETVVGLCLPDRLARAPDLHVADLLHLGLVLLTVVLLAVVLQGALGLLASDDAVVQLVEDGLQGVLEPGRPVNGTAAGGCRASFVHPVHAVGADEGVQRLGSLLDGLVEGLAGAVAALAENLVLGQEHTVNAAHQAATLAVQVGVDLLLEGGLVEVAGADGHAEGNGLLLSLAGDVLVDGERGVDAAALTEERADGAARALGSDQDDVDVLGDINLGEVLEDGGETVGEVQGL